MTTVDEARRRSTDDMLAGALEEAGNHDAQKVAAGGRPLHFDAYSGLATHREALRPSDREGGWKVGTAAVGKGVGAGIDWLVDKGVGAMASSALARGVAGASWQVLSVGPLAYHLYTEGYEKPHREKDAQLALGASDAGVVGLAQALPFDEDFKRAVTTTHAGSAKAAAGVAANLAKPERRAELAELALRADRGLVDAAPLARSAAPAIAACMRDAAAALGDARTARARGDEVAAARSEERASSSVAHAAQLEKAALAPLLGRAHADAAYGLGVQSAVHHALRVELGKEAADTFGASLAKARANLASVEPPIVRVQG